MIVRNKFTLVYQEKLIYFGHSKQIKCFPQNSPSIFIKLQPLYDIYYLMKIFMKAEHN